MQFVYSSQVFEFHKWYIWMALKVKRDKIKWSFYKLNYVGYQFVWILTKTSWIYLSSLCLIEVKPEPQISHLKGSLPSWTNARFEFKSVFE